MPLSKLEQETLDSYHLVGLTDARLVSSQLLKCGTQDCAKMQLAYTLSGTPMQSSLLIVDCVGSTGLFTFTAPSSSSPLITSIRDELVASLSISVNHDAGTTEAVNGTRSFFYYFLVAALGAAVAIFWFQRKLE